MAHKEIDLKNPKTNVRNAGFTIEEREKLTKLLDSGFVDTFRYKYPDATDAYTWWSYLQMLIRGGPICLKPGRKTWDGA